MEIKVNQADRDLAAEAFGAILTAEHIRRGCYDEDIMVQAFARHRIAAIKERDAQIVAWLREQIELPFMPYESARARKFLLDAIERGEAGAKDE